MVLALVSALAVLFLAKIAWNVALPYVLHARAARAPERANMGISLMPQLEIILVLVTWLIARLGAVGSPFTAERILIWGISLIVVSLALFFVGGLVAHLVFRKAPRWSK